MTNGGRKHRPRLSNRTIVRVGWTLFWLVNAGLVLNLVGYINEAEDACADYAIGVYGDSGWSWLPPGETCTYQVQTADSQAETLTTTGSWYMVWTVLLLVMCAALLVVLGRLRRQPTVPAWYVDPLRDNRLRYWDGHDWTEHTAPGAHGVTGQSDTQPG